MPNKNMKDKSVYKGQSIIYTLWFLIGIALSIFGLVFDFLLSIYGINGKYTLLFVIIFFIIGIGLMKISYKKLAESLSNYENKVAIDSSFSYVKSKRLLCNKELIINQIEKELINDNFVIDKIKTDEDLLQGFVGIRNGGSPIIRIREYMIIINSEITDIKVIDNLIKYSISYISNDMKSYREKHFLENPIYRAALCIFQDKVDDEIAGEIKKYFQNFDYESSDTVSEFWCNYKAVVYEANSGKVFSLNGTSNYFNQTQVLIKKYIIGEK